MQAIGQPEGTRQENAVTTWESIDAYFLRTITEHKTVLNQLAFNRFDCPAHTLVRDWQKADQRHHEKARIHGIGAVKLGEGFFRSAISAFANLGVDLITDVQPALD